MIPVLTVQVNGKTRPLTSNTTHEAKRLNRIGRIPATSPCSWLQAIATCPILPRHREVTVQIAGVLGEELVSAICPHLPCIPGRGWGRCLGEKMVELVTELPHQH